MGVESEREGEGGEDNEDHILPNTSMIGRTLAIQSTTMLCDYGEDFGHTYIRSSTVLCDIQLCVT